MGDEEIIKAMADAIEHAVEEDGKDDECGWDASGTHGAAHRLKIVAATAALNAYRSFTTSDHRA